MQGSPEQGSFAAGDPLDGAALHELTSRVSMKRAIETGLGDDVDALVKKMSGIALVGIQCSRCQRLPRHVKKAEMMVNTKSAGR